MERIYRLLLFFIIIGTIILGYIIDVESMIPAFIIFLNLLILIIDNILTRYKIKKGKYIKIGKDKFIKWKLIILLLIGISSIWGGYLLNSDSTSYYLDNSLVTLGILMIIYGITTQNYLLLFKRRTVMFTDGLSNNELKYKNLNKIEIKDEFFEMNYDTGKEILKYSRDEFKYFSKLVDFLESKIGSKLIITNKELFTTQK
jgi:hypothetical protein